MDRESDVCGMVTVGEDAPVPLQSVQLEVVVVDLTARVEVTQQYINREAGMIECVYYFPVEEEAAVVEFKAELEGRTIRTEVKRKEEARAEYEAAADAAAFAVAVVAAARLQMPTPQKPLTPSREREEAWTRIDVDVTEDVAPVVAATYELVAASMSTLALLFATLKMAI